MGADQERRRLAAAPDADARRRRGRRCPTRRRCRPTTRWSRCSPQWRDRGGPSPEPALHADPGADPPRPDARRSACARFTREVDAAWRRTSYSSLSKVEVAAGSADAVASEPEVVGKDDEELDGRLTRSRRPRSDDAVDRRAVADGRTCRWARRSARWCTPCSSTPTRGAPTSAPSCSATSTSSCGWWPVELDREELADALVAVCDSPLGPAGRRRHPARRSRSPTGCARWTSSCRWPAATCAAARPTSRLGDLAPLLRAAPARGRPGAGLRRRRCAAPLGEQACAATSPGRSTSCCGCRRPRPALPRRRLQDQLARPARRAADRRSLPARGAGRRDGPLRLPAPGAAVRRRAAPLPALAPARLRPRAAPRRRALPLPPRHVRPRHPAGRRGARAGCSPGGRRCRWSRSCPTCSTGGWWPR